MAISRLSLAGMSRDEWLAERRKSLGGSDMGAVLGLNMWRSPFTVWAEKTGKLPEQPDNEAMRQGRDLEHYVAARFEEASGKTVQRTNYILRNDDAPHLHANIDRRIVGERSGLECKTASALSAKRYAGGEFPESYYAQCVTYLAVTGWERWYLAALVLNKAFFVYQITTVPDDECPAWCESSVYVSPEELDALKESAADFWTRYIEANCAPPVDGTESTSDTLNSIYEDAAGETELFGREDLLSRYRKLTEQKKDLDVEIEKIKQQLLTDLGGAARGFCSRWTVTNESTTCRSFDYKACIKAFPELDFSEFFKTTTFKRFTVKEDKAG